MAALDDVVVENVAEALCIVLAVEAVLPVYKGREGGGVGHLAADHSGFHLAAAKVAAHLLNQLLLHFVYELGALIVEYIAVAFDSRRNSGEKRRLNFFPRSLSS